MKKLLRLFLIIVCLINSPVLSDELSNLSFKLKDLHQNLSALKNALEAVVEELEWSSPDTDEALEDPRTEQEIEISAANEELEHIKILKELPLYEVNAIKEFFGHHQATLKKIPKFEAALKSKDQQVISGNNLEYFFASQDLDEFESLVTGEHQLPTNDIRNKLAKKWVRNAAVRVFNDDLRSFLEIVVNACDAVIPQSKSVGKFGLGFFSILSLLGYEETQGVEIKIHTKYKVNDERTYKAYTMKFNKTGPYNVWTDADIKIDLTWHKDPAQSPIKSKTGTIIEITPKTGLFSQETLAKLRDYTHFLHQYPHTEIKLIYHNKTQKLFEEKVNPSVPVRNPNIEVVLAPNKLQVIDSGIGIPLKTALLKLLVPSSSTKGTFSLEDLRKEELGENLPEDQRRAKIMRPKLIRKSSTKVAHDKQARPGSAGQTEKKSHFYITVNGVNVIDKLLDQTFKDNTGSVVDVVLPMPQATQLTVARDELEVDPSGNGFEETYLKKMLTYTLEDALLRNKNPEIIPILYQGLKQWEQGSAAGHLAGRFSSYLRQEFSRLLSENKNIVPVPQEHFSQFKRILESFPHHQYKPLALTPELANFNFSKLENIIRDLTLKRFKKDEQSNEHKFLQAAADKKYIIGFNLFFVPDDALPKNASGQREITRLGLRETIFAPISLLHKVNFANLDDAKDELANEIATRFTDFMLEFEKPKKDINLNFVISTFSNDLETQYGNGLNLKNSEPENDNSFFDYYSKNKRDYFESNPKNISLKNTIMTYNRPKGYIDFLNWLIIPPKNRNLDDLSYINFICYGTLYPYQAENGNLSKKNAIYLDNTKKKIFPFKNNLLTNQNDFRNVLLALLKPFFNDKRLFNPNFIPAVFNYLTRTHYKFIGFKDASKEEVDTFLRKSKEFLLTFSKYQNALSRTFNNFSITEEFIDIFTLQTKVEKQRLTQKSRKKMNQLIKTILGMYDQYFVINDRDLEFSYGNKLQCNTINRSNDTSPELITQLLAALEKNESLFDKLIGLQLEDFAHQTNSDFKKKNLTHKKLFIPNILSNSPLSMLAQIYSLTKSIQLIETLLTASSNTKELMIASHLLSDQTVMTNIKRELAAKQNISITINTLIEKFIRERIEQDKLNALYQNNLQSKNQIERLTTLKNEAVIKIINDFLNSALSKESLFQLKEKAITENAQGILKKTKQFSLSKLMKAHMLNKGLTSMLENDKLEEIIKTINTIDEPIDSGKILQAVEAGSEKNPIEASIIESLQNSIDAIKSFERDLSTDDKIKKSLQRRESKFKETSNAKDEAINELTSINYKLERVPAKKSKKATGLEHQLITITDHVGMPSLKTLLTDLVLPDYSGKSPAQGNIGDMGNGTFKLYQDASMVTFTTRPLSNLNKVYLLRIIPQRNKAQQVYDLRLSCVDVGELDEYKDFDGTEIKILFREQSSQVVKASLSATRYFLRNACGATNVTITVDNKQYPVTLKLEEHDQNQPPKSIVLNEAKEITNQHKFFKDGKNFTITIRPRTNNLLQTYITTAGIPFRDLLSTQGQLNLVPSNFAPLFSSGFIIDLPPGSYEPVQSRTNLKMKHPYLIELKKALIDAFYIEKLKFHQDDTEQLGQYFTHFASQVGDFTQLRLDKNAAQKLEKLKSQLFSRNLNDTEIPLNLFFNYHKIHGQNSFCEILDPLYGNNKLFEIISGLKFNFGEESSKWINQNKQKLKRIKTDHDKINFRNEWKQALNTKQAELNTRIKQYFNSWKQNLEQTLRLKPFPLLYQKVLLPWVENKIPDTQSYQYIDDSSLFNQFPNLQTKAEKEALEEQKKKNKITWTAPQPIKPKKPLTKEKRQSKKKSDLHKLLDLLANSYAKAFSNSNAQCYFNPSVNVEGFWSGSEIKINLARISIHDQVQLLTLLVDKKLFKVRSDPGYQSLYDTTLGNPGTMIHELEHARRTQQHTDEGSHDNGTDAQGHYVNFNACSNSYAEKALQNGLIKKWRNKLIQSLGGEQKAQLVSNDLKKNLEKFKTEEEINKNQFAQDILFD